MIALQIILMYMRCRKSEVVKKHRIFTMMTNILSLIFTARRYASAVLAVIVCLSVCPSVRLSVRPSVRPSVTSRSCTKMAKPLSD